MNEIRESKIVFTGAVLVILVGILTSALLQNGEAHSDGGEITGAWACRVETYTCPDGTLVDRVPPYCHFAECPK